MYKFLAITLASFFITSISHASVEGKGLFCADEKVNNPLFLYFKDSTTFQSFSIKGYEIFKIERPYTLDGAKTIEVNFPHAYYRINRQTLKISRGNRAMGTCAVVNSRQDLISKMQSFINKAKNKNKI
tara:strand:- start:67 stop:450 length:384 start_codon:yes stop_codon:yes gene_type:complete